MTDYPPKKVKLKKAFTVPRGYSTTLHNLSTSRPQKTTTPKKVLDKSGNMCLQKIVQKMLDNWGNMW